MQTKRFTLATFSLLLLTLFSLKSYAAKPEFVNEVSTSTATLSTSGSYGDISTTVGKFGPSFEFTKGNHLTMDLPQDYTTFTLAFWFRWSANTCQWPTLFCSLDHDGGAGGTYNHLTNNLTPDNGKAVYRVNKNTGSNNEQFFGTPTTRETWHHFVYMRDGSTHYFFVDGVLQGTYTQANPNSCKTIYFGGLKKGINTSFDSGCHMTGFVDEIAVWDKLKYSTTGFTVPTAEYNASDETNLVALFHVNSQYHEQAVIDTKEHKDVYGTWANGKWWQEVGYAGVGNQNEVLAVAELDLVPVNHYSTDLSIYDPAVTITKATPFNLSVAYKLLGKAKDSKYVKSLKLWARPYDPNYDDTQVSHVDNTFAYPFDQRDPVGKSGAILLSQSPVPGNEADEVLFNVSLTPAQNKYVLYFTADIADDLDKVTDNDIAFLQSETKTELGADLVSLTYSGTMSFDYTYKTSSAGAWQTGSKADYAFSNEEVYLTRADGSRVGADGSRVLVPEYHVLYAPNDFYSKYYRIPAIARAADGSIVAISDARKHHIHDITNDIDMLARRSTDGGRTWSDPVTIAKGTGYNETTGVCTSAMGYGDAAIATLPNGNIIVTMIWGYSLSTSNVSQDTKNFYCLSRDNGQTWSAPKEIPQELTRASSSARFERGCVAPGNMCVVKNGVFKDKVLACFRTTNTYNGTATHYNYILCYDPETEAWSTIAITKNGTNYQYVKVNNSSTAEDEAHLVEVGNNTFLMSIRDGAGYGYRSFCLLTYNESTGRFVQTSVSDNMAVGTACNGDIMKYVAKDKSYILHTLPSAVTSSSWGDVRKALKFYYTTYTGQSSVSWTTSVNISDPYDNDYRNETGQYSSITQLDDGSIFTLFEEYPTIIRVMNDRGDYLMQSSLIKLRIGDIVPNAEPVDVTTLKAPSVGPVNQTYDSSDPNARPEITISQDNTEVPNVTTHYEITVYAKDGSKIGVIHGTFFNEGEKTIHWTEIANQTFTVGGETKTLEQIVYGGGYNSGVHISVSAYCTSDDPNYEVSPRNQRDYVFGNPIIPFRIVTREQTGWGDPYMQAQHLGNFYQNEVLRVSKESSISVVANDKHPYNFVGFSFDPYNYTPLNTQEKALFQVQEMSPKQINIIVPDIDSTSPYLGPDNVVTIYAWYETTLFGLKTRVHTNQSISEEGEEPEYIASDWSRPEDEGDFPESSPNLTFADVVTTVNPVEGSLPYGFVEKTDDPTKYEKVDAVAMIMPDSRAMKYNAVAMAVKVDATPSQVSAKKAQAQPKADTNYILIQGTKTPLSDTLKAEDGSNVAQWYETDENGVNQPVLLDNLTFPGIVPEQAKAGAQTPEYNIVYYVIDGDITSLTGLDSDPNLKAVITHNVSNDPELHPHIPTAIETIDYTAREVSSILYYNLTGAQSLLPYEGVNIVVTTFSDGTRLVEKVLKK